MSEITDIVRKVSIKSGLNTTEDVLRFRIWTHNQNLLKIDISNDRNPLFQCFIELTEAKFKEIREGQDINISSLDNLKSELIKLFLRCEGKDEKETRFFLLLEEAGNSANFQGYDVVRRKQLKIVEKSALKNLVHFTFDVVDATDEEIKTALIGQIDGLKNLYRTSDAKVNELEIKLIESNQLVSAKLNELAAVRKELELLSTSYENEKRELIAEVGETECKLKREFEKKFRLEKEDFQKQHKSEIDHLKQQQKELRAENKTLKQSLDELQTSLQNESQRCGILEVRLGNTLQEVEQLKTNNAKLDTDYHDKEKNVYTLRTRLAVCEQELKDKACFISSLQKQTDKAVSEKEYFQNYVQDLEKELSFRDETVSKLAKDILKANEIIARQAAELDTLKDKVKVATSVAFEQEKVLKQKSEDITRLEKDLESEKGHVEKLEKDKESLSKEIEMINESLALCKNKTDIDSKVIAWFSRALRFYSSTEESNAQITNSTPLSDIGASVRANIIGASSDMNNDGYGKFPIISQPLQNDYISKSGHNAGLDKHVPDYVLSRLSDIQNDPLVDEQGKRTYRPQDYRTTFQENPKELSSRIPIPGSVNSNGASIVPSNNLPKDTLNKNHIPPLQLPNDNAPLESDRSRKTTSSRNSANSKNTANSRKDKEVGRRFPGSSSYFQ